MKLIRLGTNQNAIELQSGRVVVLFSYNTPVAAYVENREGKSWVRTSQKYSVTTSKHINQWLCGVDADLVEQEYLDGLLQAA